jgi:predicted dehydrogenase
MGFISEGGGAFRDMGVHVLDAVWWMMGMPRPVSAVGVAGAHFGQHGNGYWDGRTPAKEFYSKFAADDFGCGFIRFDNGIGLQIESFWASHQPGAFQIELFGTEAGAKLSPLTLYSMDDGAEADTEIKLPKQLEGFDLMAEEFIGAILDGTEFHAPLRHGLVVQQMMEAVLRSGETGVEERIDAAME